MTFLAAAVAAQVPGAGRNVLQPAGMSDPLRMPQTTALNKALARWSLTRPVLLCETATSRVFRVTTSTGDVAVLKLLKSGAGQDERHGAELLRWYGGEGAVAVHGATRDAVLMEWAGDRSLGDLARGGRDADATDVLCDTIARLHAPRVGLPAFEPTPLQDRFGALSGVQRAPIPQRTRSVLASATTIAHRLLDAPTEVIPLHGDIHHDNILNGPRGWLAIDPKGLLGEQGYEYANSFRNPERADRLILDRARIERHADALAARSGIARKRLLGWAVAHAALSAAWDMEVGEPAGLQISLIPLLLAAYEAG